MIRGVQHNGYCNVIFSYHCLWEGNSNRVGLSVSRAKTREVVLAIAGTDTVHMVRLVG